ncbi:MAG: diphthine synthase [Candidatus Aenigmarchaeota archaeon]|nr:diphthine synthase [Candidatus Aenigmarchaeota archaeon]
MLTLIGLGLNDEYDLTLRGIDAAKEADKVYCEFYTGKWAGSVENLQELVKNQVFMLKRADMEEGSGRILEEAKSKKVVIFTQGDPMVATTHATLLVEARKLGIETRIIHNSSIFSAVAETGLHVYKFGATVTVPFMEKTMGKLPKSVYNLIGENKSRGLHTLCLLDINSDATGFMTPTQAVDILLAMEREFGEGVIGPSQKVVVLCKAGGKSQIFYEEIEAFQIGSIESTPSVLVLPGKLHFTEEDYLQKFKSS